MGWTRLGLVCHELNFQLFSQAGGKWHTARAFCQIRHLCIFICKSPTTKETEVNFYPWQMALSAYSVLETPADGFLGSLDSNLSLRPGPKLPLTVFLLFFFHSEQTQGSGLWLIDSWRHPIKLEEQQGYREFVAGVKYHHLSTFYAILTPTTKKSIRAM